MSKIYINNFYKRDQKALMSLSRCGHCSHTNLNNYIADKRIKNYVRDGLIGKEVFNKNNGEQLIGYKLTGTGRTFVAKEYGFKDHQIAQSLTHDLGISNKYFSLSEEQRESWKTETQLSNELEERLEQLRNEDRERYEELKQQLEKHKISVPDASYELEPSIEICFEVITNSYGRAEIEAKERYVEIMNIKYETERV